MAQVNGFHHITAIAGDAQRNYDFYTKVLGLRMLKKTVNFDDPHTYHFYFGNEAGDPGTILTFFPWQNVKRGKRGSGMATEFSYSVPEGALDYWVKRLDEMNVIYTKPSGRMGESYIALEDPDGLKIELVEVADDTRKPYSEVIPEDYALRGFHSATLTINSYKQTAEILMEGLGFDLHERQGNRYRFTTNAKGFGNVIDLVELPSEGFGTVSGGCVHHIAFSVPDDDAQEEVRNKMRSMGMNPTEQIDRQYFHSVYFREPGGVLFEIATDTPGFAIDEDMSELGTSLKLPPQYEPRRQEIERALPELND